MYVYELEKFANVYGEDNWESDEEFIYRFEKRLELEKKMQQEEYCGIIKEDYRYDF